MTNQPPPVMPGYPTQPPRGDWTPQPPAPKSRGLLLCLIGATVIAFGAVGALGFVLVGQSGHKVPSPVTTTSPVATLTQAGAQRACRTAFSKEFEDRQEANVKKDVIVSVQGIDIAETWEDGAGYAVNGTVRYTLTAWPVDPVQETLELTCKVTGVDERPVTFVDNRN